MPSLFFALWPCAAVRDALYALAQQVNLDCGGRVTRRENLHLTLVFMGNMEVGRLAELRSVAGGITRDAFEFTLGKFGYWGHNRIVWAAPHAVPAPLHGLVAALDGVLEQARFEFDRRPYAPHLTLIRNAREPRVLPALDVPWRALEFVLMQSVREHGGARYEVVGSWPLAARCATKLMAKQQDGHPQ